MRCFLFQISFCCSQIHPSIHEVRIFDCVIDLTNEMWCSNILECYVEVKKTFSVNSSEKKIVELHIVFSRNQEITIQRTKERVLYEAHMTRLLFANKSFELICIFWVTETFSVYYFWIEGNKVCCRITYNMCQTLFKWLNVWLVR